MRERGATMNHGDDTKALHDSVHYEHDLEAHDSWFRHAADEPHHQQAHGGTNAWGIIGFMAGTLLVVVVVAGVTYYGLFEPMMRQRIVEDREGRPVNAEFVSARAAGQQQLASYEWVDASQGTVRVPLEAAKRLQLEEHLKAAGVKR